MLHKVGLIVCVFGLMSAPSWAQGADTNSESDPSAPMAVALADENAAPEPERLVCRRMQVTGSRRIHRYCFTQEEWAEVREQDRQDLEEIIRDGQVQTNDGPPLRVGATGPVDPSPTLR